MLPRYRRALYMSGSYESSSRQGATLGPLENDGVARMPPIATVIIPTYQRPDHLALCLASVERARAECPEDAIETVVTDDSRDAVSRELVERQFQGVRYVQGPRRGPASNRNCGASIATGPWLVFIDDDCIADLGWLAAYLEVFGASDGTELFEGRTRADRPRRSYAEESPTNESGGYLWSCNMAISTRLFKQMNGFCETFPHPALEDVDFRMRLARAGRKATFLPEASVCHPYRPMRGLEFFRRHNESYKHLLELHPDLREALNWKGILLNTARMLFATARSGLRYGLSGTGRVAYAALSKAMIDARVLRSRVDSRGER